LAMRWAERLNGFEAIKIIIHNHFRPTRIIQDDGFSRKSIFVADGETYTVAGAIESKHLSVSLETP
jgi:hypothetical protein